MLNNLNKNQIKKVLQLSFEKVHTLHVERFKINENNCTIYLTYGVHCIESVELCIVGHNLVSIKGTCNFSDVTKFQKHLNNLALIFKRNSNTIENLQFNKILNTLHYDIMPSSIAYE